MCSFVRRGVVTPPYGTITDAPCVGAGFYPARRTTIIRPFNGREGQSPSPTDGNKHPLRFPAAG